MLLKIRPTLNVDSSPKPLRPKLARAITMPITVPIMPRSSRLLGASRAISSLSVSRSAIEFKMAEISKDSKFTLSLELIVILGGVIVTTAGMWFTLQAEIEEAKKLPPSEVSRTEYDLKDQLIRETIMNTQMKVEQNSKKLDDIDEKLYELIKSK